MSWCDVIDSPVGPLLLVADREGLLHIVFRHERHPIHRDPTWVRDSAPFVEVTRQLREYFDGTRREFDLSLSPRGTPFQLQVWAALRDIPFGVTISYGELARRIGDRGASRAVGAANGRNPLPIIVPCHRVIGANGDLTGFGGGLPIKRWLLRHEGAWQDNDLFGPRDPDDGLPGAPA